MKMEVKQYEKDMDEVKNLEKWEYKQKSGSLSIFK